MSSVVCLQNKTKAMFGHIASTCFMKGYDFPLKMFGKHIVLMRGIWCQSPTQLCSLLSIWASVLKEILRQLFLLNWFWSSCPPSWVTEFSPWIKMFLWAESSSREPVSPANCFSRYLWAKAKFSRTNVVKVSWSSTRSPGTERESSRSLSTPAVPTNIVCCSEISLI